MLLLVSCTGAVREGGACSLHRAPRAKLTAALRVAQFMSDGIPIVIYFESVHAGAFAFAGAPDVQCAAALAEVAGALALTIL